MKSNSRCYDGNMPETDKSEKSSLNSHLSIQNLLIDTYQQVFNLQLCLIKELAVNKNLIQHFINKNKSFVHNSSEKSIYVRNSIISPSFISKSGQVSQNPSSLKIENNALSEQSSVKKVRRVKRIKKRGSSGSCYNPSSENSDNKKAKSIRQTKHVPKNYGKSIINFMTKHPEVVEELCVKDGKRVEQLWKVLQLYKGRIYTVANLRSMWLQEENPFAKVFRIISMFYLRKHCLQHIFNSRVQNHTRHIKYRYKIIQAVKNPSSFSQIKDY